jgi:hypothetical protein
VTVRALLAATIQGISLNDATPKTQRRSIGLQHFDLPLRGCTVALDGEPVVDQGRLL